MVNNIPVNGWPQLKDLEAVQPILNRLDKIEAWKRTVKEETFTGDDITIENALALPARSLKTVINAIQDLHGLPFPYVGGAYKNKFNPNFTGVTGITPSVDSNGYLILTVSGAVSTTFLKGQSIALKANTAYTLSCAGASSNVKVSLRNSDGSAVYASVEVDGGSSAYTPSEDITVYFYIRVETSAALTAALKPQLEEGSRATDFAPYSNICPISGRDSVVLTRSDGDEISEDFTIQLGQTVYGADINWDTGAMMITWSMKTDDDYTMKNGDDSGGGLSWYDVDADYRNSDLISSHLVSKSGSYGWNSTTDCVSAAVRSGNIKCIRIYSSCSTIEELKTKYTGLQICYPLATPTTIQLTPEQLEMLKGYNHITLSDGYGTIELKALTGANWS